MFCRSCWTNLPDGTRQCPKCQADPVAPPASPSAAPAPAPAIAAPRPTRLDRMTRLNILLVTLLVTVVGGPSGVRWVLDHWVNPPAREPTAGAAMPEARPSVAPPAVASEPAPAGPVTGPEAALAQEAFTLYQQGRLAEACDRYRDLVNRVGGAEARRNHGACLARLGREAAQAGLPAMAIDYFERAVQASPETPRLWVGLAAAYLGARDPGRAQSVLEQAARTFPDDPELLYRLAETHERQGRSRDAAETLRRLLGAHPDHRAGRTLLAVVEREQKAESDYWSQESRHFLVRYEGARGIDLGRSVVDTLEEAYDSIGRELGVFPSDRLQVGIYASDVFGEVTGAPPHLIAGVYDQRKIRLNLSASVAYSRSLSRLVRHEYAHAIIHEVSRGQAPLWVHEGLAQVLEPRSAPRSLATGVPRELLTLRGIERLSRSGNPDALVAGYQLTHVAVEYLLERGGLGKLRDFLARLGQGAPVESALRETFGFGPEEIEARLLAIAGLS
jgi:tetratricopeptide (TPR) repeat protein